MERAIETGASEAFAEVAKGLAHPSRLELLEVLAQGERCVDGLAAAAGLRVTTASNQLQTLHRCGLVARRRNGQRVLYRLAGDDVATLVATLRSVAERHAAGAALARHELEDGEDDVPVVDVAPRELLARARAGEVVVLDVRPPDEFAAGHLPGARSVPLADLAARLDEIPAGTDVVAYCRGRYCLMSHDAVRLLRARGRTAAVLSDGVLEWRAAGGPLEVAA